MRVINIEKKEKNKLIIFIFILLSVFLLDIPISEFVVNKLKTVNNGIIQNFSYYGTFHYMILFNITLVIIYILYNFGNREKLEKISKFITVQIMGLIILRILKFIFGRMRPYMLQSFKLQNTFTFFNLGEDFSSFPSGHSFSTWVLIIALIELFNIKGKWKYILYIYGILMAISRVLLNVHYLSDVFIGSILGILLAKKFYSLNKIS